MDQEHHTQPQVASPVTPPPVAEKKPSSGLAIASMVLSLVGATGFIYIGSLLALVGLILGIISLVTKGGGRGMAIAGIVVGGFCLLLSPLTIFMAINFWEGFAQGMAGY